MSAFGDLSDLMGSVASSVAAAPLSSSDLRFSFREITVLVEALHYYLGYLQSEYDQNDHIFSTYDVNDDVTVKGLIDRLLSYSFG